MRVLTRVITTEIKNEAKKIARKMGVLDNSITKGKGNLAGIIGDLQVAREVNGFRAETYDYDVLTETGLKVDVKTKRTTVMRIMPYYEASIAKYNTHQKCDVYAFCRVNLKENLGFIIGWKEKKRYFRESVFLKKGEVDPSNNYTVKADCWNLPYSKLNPFPLSFFGEPPEAG